MYFDHDRCTLVTLVLRNADRNAPSSQSKRQKIHHVGSSSVLTAGASPSRPSFPTSRERRGGWLSCVVQVNELSNIFSENDMVDSSPPSSDNGERMGGKTQADAP